MGTPLERYLSAPNDTQQLDLSVKTGVQQNPDQAARVLRLQMRTGLPQDFINRNLDSLEQQAKSADFDPSQYAKASPAVAQWVAENPQHAALAAPDMTKLGYLERQVQFIKNRFREGQLSNDLQDIGESAIAGTVTPAQRAQQAQIESELANGQQNYGITGFFEGIPGAIANQVPMLGSMLAGKVKAAAVGAGAGALIGAGAGALAGAPTGPGEAVTVPGGALAGATRGGLLGWRYGAAIAFARQETATSYLEFEKLRDDQGRPLDRNIMLGASIVDGVLNGALAEVGLSKLAENIPGLRALGSSEIRQALMSPTARGALTGYLRNVGESAATMGVVSFLQTVIRHGAGAIAQLASSDSQQLSAGQVLDRLFPPEVMAQAKEAALTGAQAGLGVGAATGVLSLPLDLQRARRASRAAQAFSNIGDAVTDTQLMQKLPEKMQEVIHRMSANTDAENVYVPAQFWNEYWQSQKLNPGEVAQEVVGNRDGYDEAQRTGGDIQIPLSRFATIIASSEHLQKFIPELRTDPSEMNQREAQEYVKGLDAQEQQVSQVKEASVGQVQSEVAQQLTSAGFDEAQAETQSKLYASTFRSLGQRTGMDPYELYKSYNLKISRPEEDQTTADLSSALEQAAKDPSLDEQSRKDYFTVRRALSALRPRAEVLSESVQRLMGYLEDPNLTPEQRASHERHLAIIQPKLLELLDQQNKSLEQSAYHGSPHVFENFSLQHIGTGEGAQAYGWGLYFAGQKEIAQWYRDKLASEVYTNALKQARDQVATYEAHLTNTPAAEAGTPEAEVRSNWEFQLTMAKADVQYYQQRAGRLFHVEIPEKDTMLDWDKSMADQPQSVRDAIEMLLPSDQFPNIDRVTGKDMYNVLSKMAMDDPGLVLPSRVIREFEAAHNMAPGELEQLASAQDYTRTRNRLELDRYAPELTSRALASQGVTGISYMGGNLAGGRANNFVIFDDQLIKVKEYEQPSGTPDQPRGRIRIGANEINIELLKNADLSTFLHETGHFYLHVLTDLATRSDVPEAITRDFEAIRTWLGSESGDFTREEHEKFARGFEAYLMEGKAPSAELRGPFARFRAWLTSIYQQIGNLNVQLTPEVRQVFDRLVAGEDEIVAAENEQAMLPLFGDPTAVGMSETQAARYQQIINDAHVESSIEMANKIAKSYQREQRRVFKDELNAQREVVGAEANNDPTLRARSLLERGKLPDGTDLPDGQEPFKLSYTSLRAYWGTETADSLGRMVSHRGGLHPDVAADLLGFASGDELVKALAESEPPELWIERNATSRAMQALNMLTPAELQSEAMKAVHGEKRAQLLQRELQWLASNELATVKQLVQKLTRRIPRLEEITQEATRIIQGKNVRDINPRLYQIAEQKSAKLAMDLFLKGDIENAFEEKQRQLLNFELYRAASDARDRIDTMTSYLARFDSSARRRRLAKAGGTYLAQIDGLLAQYEFRYQTGPALEKRQSLLDFVQEQQKLGYTPDIPEDLLRDAQRTNYRDLPFERVQQIYQTVQQLEHLAKLKNTLLKSATTRDFNAAKDAMIASIREYHDVAPEPIDLAKGLGDRIKSGTKGIIAAHTKPEFLFEWLDGNTEQGPVWTQLFKPMIQAENDEHQMMRSAVKELNAIFGEYPRSERATWFWHKEKFDGMPAFTKASKLALALNWGNKYNRQAVMDGYGWSEAQVTKVLDTLDERDWKTVQRIWDHLDTYWPQISALEKRLNGLAPERVEASPVQTKFGEMRGGYYPVVFDRNLAWRASLVNQDALDAQRRGSWGFKQTLHGHTQERTDSNAQPIKLDLTGLTRHISGVIHDLTHREAIIDVRRLANHDEVRGAIEGSVGKEMYRQINPWLDNIAVGQPSDYANPIEGFLNRARMGSTIVNIGWKATTSLVHFFNYTGTIKEIGPLYTARGIADVYAQPWKWKQNFDFVTSRSEFMKDRLQTFDRDVNESMRKMNIAGIKAGPMSVAEAYTSGLKHSWFTFVGLGDMGAALPSWLGAYKKAMEGGVEGLSKGNEFMATDYADKVIRQTRGVGASKDLATVQRGPEAYKLFTMFYSYWNVLFNQFAKSTHQYQLDQNSGNSVRSKARFIASMAMLWFAPAVLHELVTGRTPSTDDDQDTWEKWFAKTEFQYPFQSVILLRDIVNGMANRGYEPSAAFDMFDSITKAGQAVGSRIGGNKDELTRSDAKNMAQAVGYTTRLPTKQLWLTGEYLYDWMSGNTNDDPMQAVWHAFVTGKPKE